MAYPNGPFVSRSPSRLDASSTSYFRRRLLNFIRRFQYESQLLPITKCRHVVVDYEKKSRFASEKLSTDLDRSYPVLKNRQKKESNKKYKIHFH